MKYELLFEQAKKAIKNSYAPYSSFNVGAALLCENGKIYTGCNIENSAFSPTVCAERTAFFKAISEGERKFDSILIIGGRNYDFSEFCTPCGVCRQVMNEFCEPTFKIIFADSKQNFKEYILKELLPNGFSI